MGNRKTHKDLEFHVKCAISDESEVIKRFADAADYALYLACSGNTVWIDVIAWSRSAAAGSYEGLTENGKEIYFDLCKRYGLRFPADYAMPYKEPIKMRQLTEKDVTFEIECLPEDADVEGNAMASGDDAVDREVEESIRNQLLRGNRWAWCTVRVGAIWTDSTGEEHVGNDTLGCCSYESEEDFKRDGYFADMKSRALEDLNEKIAWYGKKAARIAEDLAD